MKGESFSTQVTCLDCATVFDLRHWRRLRCPKGWAQSPDIDDRIHRISARRESEYRTWRREQKRPAGSRYDGTHDEHARTA
jgi:hypothetical protein